MIRESLSRVLEIPGHDSHVDLIGDVLELKKIFGTSKDASFLHSIVKEFKLRVQDQLSKDCIIAERLTSEIANLKASVNTIETDPWILDIDGYITRFSKLTCPDKCIMDIAQHNHSRIKNHYTEAINELGQDIKQLLASLKGVLSSDQFASWIKIREEYLSDARTRSFCIERLAMEFPRFKKTQIANIDSAFDKNFLYNHKLKSLKEQYSRQLLDQIENTVELYKKVHQIVESEQEQTRLFEEQVEKTRSRHEKVSKWKRKQILLVESEMMEKERKDQELLAVQKRISASMKAQRRKNLQKISIFHQERTRKEQARIQEERKRAIEAETVRLSQASVSLAITHQYHKERVEFRQQEIQERKDDAKKAAEALQELTNKRAERLERLRQSVAIKVESDWDRILQETESIKNAQQVTTKKGNVTFVPIGYSVETIFKDPRSKLADKLRSSGLLQNEYARQLLAQLQTPQRPHLASSLKIE